MPPLITIAAVDIDIGGRSIDCELPASWIDAALADARLEVGVGDWEAKSRPQGGQLRGRVSRSGKDVVVRAQVEAEVVLACSRCLAPVGVPVDGELSLLLQPVARSDLRQPRVTNMRRAGGAETTPADGEYEFGAQEAALDVYNGETVVLDGFLREAILLELPQFPLCSEGCVGIPAAPAGPLGAEQPPVDPRLAPLGALRSKLTGEPIPAELDPGQLAPAPRRTKPILRSNAGRGLSKKKRKKRKR